MEIQIPYNFQPRSYQLPVMEARDGGCKRMVLVWHRRAGKEKTCINITSKEMTQRIGSYYYVFPELVQGRKVLWDGADKDGFRFLNHFPREYIEGEPNNTEMKLRYKNQSLFQVVGSDNFDSVMGTNPVGMVFSEYSLQNPRCWGHFRPILAENGGWAIFDFTPRGENHAFDLFNLAVNDPNWFCQLLTVDSTNAISKEVLDQERREIVRLDGNDALFQQEYYCSFTSPIQGAYYATQIQQAYAEGRVGRVPHDPSYRVDTWWDLGFNDTTAIWFTQSIGSELRIVDYHEESGQGLPHYFQVLEDKRKSFEYAYGTHTGPHDLEVHELATGKSRLETARKLGIDFRVCPKLSIRDGIDAGRNVFKKCWFDKDKCQDGLNSLKNYRKVYDESKRAYLDQPYHDWASNGADAFRYLAIGLDIKKSGIRAHKDIWSTPDVQRAPVSPMAL